MTTDERANFGRVMVGVIFLLTSLESLASSSAKELLSLAGTHFDHGQYQKALNVINSIDIRRDLDSSDDMKLAFKIRAIAYEEVGDQKSAIETIRELFFLDPTYNFDPFDTPISVVKLASKITHRSEK